MYVPLDSVGGHGVQYCALDAGPDAVRHGAELDRVVPDWPVQVRVGRTPADGN